MNEAWWESASDFVALDIRDTYVQQLLYEFRYLSEKENKKDAKASPSPVGDEKA